MGVKKLFAFLFCALFLLSGCYNAAENTPTAGFVPTPAPSAVASPPSAAPTPAAERKFSKIAMATARCGYALSIENHLFKNENGGVDWRDMGAMGKMYDFRTDFCVIDEETVCFAANDNNQVIYMSSKDGGKTWSKTALAPSTAWEKNDLGSVVLSFFDAEHGYLLVKGTPAAGQMVKALYKTTDGGAHWISVCKDDMDQRGITSGTGINGYPEYLVFRTAKNGYISSTSNGPHSALFYKTTDGGETWESVPQPEFPEAYKGLKEFDFWISAGAPSFYGDGRKNGKMILGYQRKSEDKEGYVYSTADGGETWTLVGKSNMVVKSYTFFDGDTGAGITEDGVFCKTVDGGLTWKCNIKEIEGMLR